MSHQILPLLNEGEVARVVAVLDHATFGDGKVTAHGRARTLKNNLQVDRGPDVAEIESIVFNGYKRSGVFHAFALPKRMMPPLFSRYATGMGYGAHVDVAVMGGSNGIRGDLASTLFLSDPATYDGGDLVIELPFGEKAFKLKAGEAIVYPAGTVHRVVPVTRGTRLAAITWVQSSVRDERLRAISFDLFNAIALADAGNNAELSMLLDKAYQNLLRHQVEP